MDATQICLKCIIVDRFSNIVSSDATLWMPETFVFDCQSKTEWDIGGSTVVDAFLEAVDRKFFAAAAVIGARPSIYYAARYVILWRLNLSYSTRTYIEKTQYFVNITQSYSSSFPKSNLMAYWHQKWFQLSSEENKERTGLPARRAHKHARHTKVECGDLSRYWPSASRSWTNIWIRWWCHGWGLHSIKWS